MQRSSVSHSFGNMGIDTPCRMCAMLYCANSSNVCRYVVLGMIVAQVGDSGLPVDKELTSACEVDYAIKVHINRFGRFCLMVSLAKPPVVELLTWIAV